MSRVGEPNPPMGSRCSCTTRNERFAMAVDVLGVRRWTMSNQKPVQLPRRGIVSGLSWRRASWSVSL